MIGSKIRKNDVVQFTENHRWCGCLGIVSEVRESLTSRRYMIGIPIPNNEGKAQTAYIFDDGSNIEHIGAAVLSFADEE